jgi:hypothetical protein
LPGIFNRFCESFHSKDEYESDKEQQACLRIHIESANRRSFIKKAALITAAASVAGSVLGAKMLPESSANAPAAVTCACNLEVSGCAVVDSKGLNGGNISSFFGLNNALTFGAPLVCCFLKETHTSGQGIASSQSGANVKGLDFYTNYKKRMSITSAGNVGIGTCNPSSTLCVVGSIAAQGVSVIVCGTGSAVFGCSVGGDGVKGASFGVTGVSGYSLDGIGICGSSGSTFGVQAQSGSSLTGKFKNNATTGDRSAPIRFENGDSKVVDWNTGVAGVCNTCKIPDGSFYVGEPSKPRVVVNTGGQVGIGTTKHRSMSMELSSVLR